MRKKINELLERGRLDAVLLRNFDTIFDPNFYYFTGLVGEFSYNFCILRYGRKPTVLSSGLEFGSLKGNKNLKPVLYASEKDFIAKMKKELKGEMIGFNASIYPISSFKKLRKFAAGKKWVDASEQLGEVRSIKLGEEIDKLAKSARIAEKTINAIPEILRKGMSEATLALELEYTAKKMGAEGLSYAAIVASGKNAAVPHAVAGSKKISKGFLLVDFGVKYKNYCSDISRTFFVGRAGKKERRLYSGVFNAKKAVEQLIKEGAKASDIFLEVDAMLKKELGMKMIHGVGHGLGIETHDFPEGFREKAKTVLKKNMVFTIEPAVYGSFGGIRIEDDLVVEKNGCRLLSRAPAELIEL